MRTLALVLLAAVALAAEPATAGTPLHWEAGRVSLADALGRLTATGNRIWLTKQVDDATEAHVPAIDGVWWDGVIAVCKAFDLRPDSGEPSDDQLDLPGQPVPVGHGTLVLSRGHPPGLQAVGGLLAAADNDGSVRLWLRAEPRLPRGSLAWARADQPSVSPSRELALEPGDPAEEAPVAARWRPSAPLATEATLHVEVQVAAVSSWNARASLTAGETVRLEADGKAIAAVLLIDPAVTTWEGKVLPERRPLVALSGPSEMMQRAQYHLRQGDSELGSRGSGTRSDQDSTVMYRYLRAAPEGTVDLEIEGRSLQSPLKMQLHLPLPAASSDPTSATEQPTRIVWEAAEKPLNQWLGVLAASGNPVLPEVGVDTSKPLAVAAVRGGFWDALLAVGTAAGLAPAFSVEAPISGGAVRLVDREVLASTASGPLLIEAQRLAGPPGQLALRLRLALEPHLSEDGFATPEFRWASWAVDEQGRHHDVESPTEANPARQQLIVIMNGQRSDAPQSPTVVIQLIAPGARRVELSGLVTLPRLHLWRGSIELVADQPAELLLGDRAVEVTALSSQVRVGNSQVGPGLLLRGLQGVAGVQFSLVTIEGQALEQSRDANRLGGRGTAMAAWLGWCRIPPQGRVTAEIAARAALPPLVLPIRLSVPVPDGL